MKFKTASNYSTLFTAFIPKNTCIKNSIFLGLKERNIALKLNYCTK